MDARTEMTRGTGSSTSAGARAGRLARGWIDRSELVRKVVKSRPAQDQIMTVRALTAIRGGSRFLLGQIAGRGTRCYELRGSGMKVQIRHGSGDVAILNKIFARDGALSSYEPPAEVAQALAGRAVPRILDVGANVGMFGVHALSRWPGAEVVAFEPDPDNFRVLRGTIAANRAGSRWSAVRAAVSNEAGRLRFVPGRGAKAHLAGSAESGAISVPAVDFFEHLGGGADLVKMDIEGGEWRILADPRLAAAPARAIRLEWHTLMCPEPDARRAAVGLLRASGFSRVLDVDRQHERNGVLWAWREPGRPPAR